MKKIFFIITAVTFGMLLASCNKEDEDNATYSGVISFHLSQSTLSSDSIGVAKVLDKCREKGFISDYTYCLGTFIVVGRSIEVSGIPASDTSRVKAEKEAELKAALTKSAAELNALDWSSVIGKDRIYNVIVNLSYTISASEIIQVKVSYNYQPQLPANSTYIRSASGSVLEKFVYTGTTDTSGHYLVNGTLDGIGEMKFIGTYTRGKSREFFVIRNTDTTGVGIYRFIFSSPDVSNMDKINLFSQRIKTRLDTVNIIYNKQ